MGVQGLQIFSLELEVSALFKNHKPVYKKNLYKIYFTLRLYLKLGSQA